MSIEGPKFVTPGGTATEGGYERHGFAYIVPDGEPDAGSRVSMTLQSEDILRMYIPGRGPGPNPPTIETWQRCDLTMVLTIMCCLRRHPSSVSSDTEPNS